jgi:hypothetical protein
VTPGNNNTAAAGSAGALARAAAHDHKTERGLLCTSSAKKEGEKKKTEGKNKIVYGGTV